MKPKLFAPALLLVAAACGSERLQPASDGGGGQGSSGANGGSSGANGGSSGQGSSGLADAAPSPFLVSTERAQAAGVVHEYVLVVPRTPAAAKLPIVLAYHGDVGTGDELRQGWRVEEASGNAAIVVYPNHPGGWEVTNQSSQNRFLAGFDAIVAAVASEHGGDATDVTALGWSNGGFMTQIIACWRSGSLRAVGAMAGSYPYDSTSTGSSWPNTFPKCEGQGAVPALIMHGDSDGVGSGELSATYWAYVNKCSPAPEGCSVDPSLRSPGLRPPCVKLDDAPASAPVHFCNLPSFGHRIWEQSAAAMWEFSRAVP